MPSAKPCACLCAALEAFAKAGYATVAHDAFGHGRSEPQDREKGFHYIKDLDDMVDDFVDLAEVCCCW